MLSRFGPDSAARMSFKSMKNKNAIEMLDVAIIVIMCFFFLHSWKNNLLLFTSTTFPNYFSFVLHVLWQRIHLDLSYNGPLLNFSPLIIVCFTKNVMQGCFLSFLITCSSNFKTPFYA